MQYFTTPLAALTAFALGVAGVPVPASTSTAPTQPCPSTALKANQSTVFGWQLAGSASNTDSLDQTCSLLTSNRATKWSQLGLLTLSIQTPVCNALSPNAETALPKLSAANTKVFTTLLLNSFDKSNVTTFSYLCDNLRYVQLDGFLLDSSLITNATCQLGGDQLNPQPFTTVGAAAVNKTAVDAYNDAQSKLFAYTSASSASSTDELAAQCSDAAQSVRQTRFEKLQLDGACVEATICGVKEPLSVGQAKAALKQYTSMTFLAVIQDISNQPGYKQWLCHSLDVDSMNAVGMDGNLVKSTVCKAAFPGEDGSGSWS